MARQHVIRDLDEIEHFGEPDIRDGLVHDLLGLDRRHAHGECAAQHPAIFAECL